MPRASVRTITFGGRSRKIMAANRAVARARAIIRTRNASSLRAPLRSGGFLGLYSRRGREELKVIDTTQTTTAAPTAGTVILLNGVAQGTDYTNRIGRKVIIKSLLMRYTLVPNTSSNTPAGDCVRLLIVYDAQCNSATPAIGDILQNSAFNDPINLNNRDRFKVLSDKYVGMGACQYAAGTLTAGAPFAKQVKVYKRMGLEQIFSGTGATSGSISTGGLFLIIIAGFNQQTNVIWTSRTRFVDA